jgi:excisionase family DNA binding protein
MEIDMQQQQEQQAAPPDLASSGEIQTCVNALSDAELPDRPTVGEIARWLRKHPNAIYNWARKGLIPGRKVGRSYIFDKAALLEWAKQREEAA